MWYNIDFDKLLKLITPPFLQKKVFMVFVSVSLEPIKTIYNDWIINRDARLYNLEHSGQVCYLRKVLNDRFDSTQRRIQIADGNQYDRTYIYTRVEQNPKYLGKLTLHSRSDYADTGVDFIVYAPSSIITENNYAIEALVNEYKQDVKRFKVVGL